MFDGTEDWCKIGRKLTWAFQNDLMNMTIFQAEKQWYHFRKKNGRNKSKEKIETTRLTKCSEKALFYLGNK